MSIKKNPFVNQNLQTTQQYSNSDLEKRVLELEKNSHTPCSKFSSKVDLSSLPELPPRKQTTIEQRLTALENKVEELIKLLSQ